MRKAIRLEPHTLHMSSRHEFQHFLFGSPPHSAPAV